MIDSFKQWAASNPDTAYLLGFTFIVAIYHGLAPYKFGLNVATSRGISFKSIDVWGQIKKPHRGALSLGAIAMFAFFHLGLGAPLLALLAGSAPVAALAVIDYRQMQRDSGASA